MLDCGLAMDRSNWGPFKLVPSILCDLMREAVVVWLKCAVRETAKRAIGCSPGCSDDNLRESSAGPRFAGETALAMSVRFAKPVHFIESQPNRRELAVARRRHEYRRICRLRLGLIRRGGEPIARRRSLWFLSPGCVGLTKVASTNLRLPSISSFVAVETTKLGLVACARNF